MSLEFSRKFFLEKAILKAFNKKAYKRYKEDVKQFEQTQRLTSIPTYNISRLGQLTVNSEEINFSHRGNAGDVIYSLPTIKKIREVLQKPVNLYLKLNEPTAISSHFQHPLGNVMLNEQMATMLIPLIQSQPYINRCDILGEQTINFNLDDFRPADFPLDRGDIARWGGYVLGINPNLHQPWLTVDPDTSFADSIVVARSARYRNPLIDYSFLNAYKNLVFVGVESEFKDMQKVLPKIEWIEVCDMQKLASVISGSKLFIGNQSLPFSIAEALKVKRILEVYINSPNVIPSGENGYDFLYQLHFSWLVDHLLQQE